MGLTSSPQGQAGSWGSRTQCQLGPYSCDPGVMQGTGPTRMTAAKRESRVMKVAMLIQWQDGLGPRKIDVSGR